MNEDETGIDCGGSCPFDCGKLKTINLQVVFTNPIIVTKLYQHKNFGPQTVRLCF